MTTFVPWILMGLTVLNMWLLAEKRREGFLVGIGSQFLWLAFDAAVGAYGLMPLALVLGVIYVRGFRRWGAKCGNWSEVMGGVTCDLSPGNHREHHGRIAGVLGDFYWSEALVTAGGSS